MHASDIDREKRAAAEAAIGEVRDGMLVGLGTGSTAAFAIAELARRCREGLSVRAVATSLHTEAEARRLGIPVVDFAQVSAVDLCIDGVDEIDPDFRAIKGGGGAMLREKIVARSAARMIAVCDSRKPVPRLSAVPLPVEVLPFARTFVIERVRAAGARPALRQTADGTVYRTDQGNCIIDCTEVPPLESFARLLEGVPGVLGHGYFHEDIDALYIGRGERVDRIEKTVRA